MCLYRKTQQVSSLRSAFSVITNYFVIVVNAKLVCVCKLNCLENKQFVFSARFLVNRENNEIKRKRCLLFR